MCCCTDSCSLLLALLLAVLAVRLSAKARKRRGGAKLKIYIFPLLFLFCVGGVGDVLGVGVLLATGGSIEKAVSREHGHSALHYFELTNSFTNFTACSGVRWDEL
jgi:hypothetical protein